MKQNEGVFRLIQMRGGFSEMKKLLVLVLGIIFIGLFTVAYADPVISDGETTGWIAEKGYLYLQSADMSIRQLPIEMENLLGMTADELFCQAKDQRIIAVKKDGSGSRIVDSMEYEQINDQRIVLDECVLTLDGNEISRTAVTYTTDDTYLYYAEQNELKWLIQVKMIKENGKLVIAGSRDSIVMMLADRQVQEPIRLNVTRDALTVTGKDHRITVMDLTNGEVKIYSATSEETAAACLLNGVLYRYRQPEENKWELETMTTVAMPTSAPVTTPTATPTPSPTQVPAAQQTYVDDDGTIYRGASGKTIRKIQSRLAELGYPVGKIDGIYGEQTQLAINLFCNAIHVQEHNYITPRVQRKLMANNAPVYDPYLPLKKGDRGVSVRYMQESLKARGYDPGKIDGIYGANTVMAVARFQGDNGIVLAPDEEPGENASRELLMLLYAPETEPTAEPTATPVPATQTDLN